MGHMQRVPSTTLSGSDSPSQTVSSHMDGRYATNGQSLPNGTSQAYDSERGEPWTQNGANGDTESSGSDAELPQVDAKMIPLSITISRLITYAYTELVTLVDTLPARTEADRRSEILKYTNHMTDMLTKLLVLVRWAKHAPQIQKCQNAIAYLDSQNRYFDCAVDSIYAAFMSMPGVRMRNYDVGNAAEILSTRSYQRLPVAIKRMVSPPKLSKKQVQETVEAISGIIRRRILCGEPVPLAMRRYVINNGRIVFTVPGEFEVKLTLLQYEENIPWHIVSVRVLVAGDPLLPGEQQIAVNTRQIIDFAQQILVGASAQSQDDGNVQPPQLVQLYDFLHQQCFTVLLETVYKQATVLRRARWENLLHVEMAPGHRSLLVIRYWTSSRAVAATLQQQQGDRSNVITFQLSALPVPRPIHAPALSDEYKEDSEFERIENDRRNLIPKIGLTVTWAANSGLAERKVWTRTVSHANELVLGTGDASGSIADFDLVLDPSSVNTEQLLRQVTWRHARSILKSLYELVVESQQFNESAVELLYTAASGVTKSESELTAEEVQLCTAIPCLRAWYRQGEGAVDITVDTYTGRVVVRASEAVAASSSLSEVMVSQLTDQLNRQPWRIAALLVDMRSSLALADLDCLVHRSLGLRAQTSHEACVPTLPGFVLSSVSQRTESAAHASQQPMSSNIATNFPLRISQQEADALVRGVSGSENPLSRIRFYMVEGTEGVEEQVGPAGSTCGEWYIMVAMTDRLQFRLVLLNPHPKDRLLYVVGQVILLQVDRLFSSVARRLLMEGRLDRTEFSREAQGSPSSPPASEREITEKADAMLTGRTSITLDYLNALASMCRARLALRLLQTQLTRWKIPYSFRLPSFSTSPHGHRAAVSSELSVVGLDKMGLYELDEQVPVLYIPISGLMRASPINWSVANQGVLPDEARRMVSIRIASDELDPSLRADLSSSTRVDQHRQAAIAALEGRAQSSRPRASYASLSNAAGSLNGRSLIGRHIIPCQVVASIPMALDGLPAPVARAYADAVHFGAHAAADGGYHRDESKRDENNSQRGYTKVVLVYKQVNRALQCLIRDWSEQHLMTHVGRHMRVWETRAMRRVVAATAAFYPFSAGPYTGAVANMLGSWRGHQSSELVVQCVGSCFVSISCRVPFPFASEDGSRSLYPPGYSDSGGNDLSFHLTLADVDSKTNRINRIASTWPWMFAHSGDEWSRAGQRSVGFEVSASLSRWLRQLQAQLNLTGNPLTALSMIVQLMPIHHIIGSISAEQNIRSLVPSLQYDAQDALIRFQVKSLLAAEDDDAQADDRSHMVLHKLAAVPRDMSRAFASVRGLQIMHMYTAVDNIRLVFNSRYVVDLRLVANDLFCISDAVQSTSTPSKHARAASVAPEPLVTATTESIPLFADWLAAMSRKMKFDWARLERGMTVILRDVVPRAGEEHIHVDAREKVRLFQRNMFSLRPGASKAERLLHGFRQAVSRQSSARSPTFLALPPSAVLCTRLHLVPVLRSLMQWLVQSVHVRDQLEMAISRTQEIVGDAAPNALLSVREKLVFMSDRKKDADEKQGQVMIVGFTGARESVRCEFLVQAGVAGRSDQSDRMNVDTPPESIDPRSKEPTQETNMDADNPAFDANDEDTIQSLLSDLFTIPADLMHVDLDVRIVPMTRPPNGITDAAAAFLVQAFKKQMAEIRQRAGVLVRILALPPQLVMDIVDVCRKLEGKAAICALDDGLEHMVRLDVARSAVRFVIRVCMGGEWSQLVLEYEMLTGEARVICVFGPTEEYTMMTEESYLEHSGQALKPWTARMAAVIAALDAQTAFTRDMGKSGKSRFYDVVHGLVTQQ
ncbi:mediator complex subunit [Coemansia sp. RSA 1822]|nr:mediator complex subunit [Coemansia sp. RSA 1853]KAJ2558765.1 mediator complex subunit [Coemansia sp. RSA 1822]